jgi:hypothetical protein
MTWRLEADLLEDDLAGPDRVDADRRRRGLRVRRQREDGAHRHEHGALLDGRDAQRVDGAEARDHQRQGDQQPRHLWRRDGLPRRGQREQDDERREGRDEAGGLSAHGRRPGDELPLLGGLAQRLLDLGERLGARAGEPQIVEVRDLLADLRERERVALVELDHRVGDARRGSRGEDPRGQEDGDAHPGREPRAARGDVDDQQDQREERLRQVRDRGDDQLARHLPVTQHRELHGLDPGGPRGRHRPAPAWAPRWAPPRPERALVPWASKRP